MTGKITFISAGAGSGKTYRLTQVLHHELKNGVNPKGIIATTFTRRAAAELRERVRKHLLVENELSLANAIGQSRIGTVNGVCGELLNRFSFEAGLSPHLKVLEESHSAMLYEESIETAITDNRISDLYQLANRLGVESWGEHVKTIANLARSNAIDSETLVSFSKDNAQSLLALFPKPSSIDIESLIAHEIDHLIPQVELAIHERPNQKNLQDWHETLLSFRQKLRQNSLQWADWAKLEKSSPPAKLRDASQPLLDSLKNYESHPMLQKDIKDYIDAVFAIASTALKEFDERKRILGAIDFIDQERKLLDILELPEVRDVLTREVELLLVDEFQDTSPIQLALFAKLAKFAQRTYWVGDTKQAIYGFRGSDSRLMEAILNNLEKNSNFLETLDSSWRSRPPLVTLNNEIFSHAFANTLPENRITLQAKRQDYSEESALQSWLLKGANRDEQAAAVASGIRTLIANGYKIFDHHTKQVRSVTYSDIAILARMNDSVLRFAEALSKVGIPTETAQPGLLKKPEAVLVIACLRRLTDETDTLATAEIVSLTSGEPSETWLQHRLNFIATHERDRWNSWLEVGEDANPIIQRLAELRSTAQVLTVREAIELVIAECQADSMVIAWSQSHARARMRLANLQALIDMAGKYEESCRGSSKIASVPGFILWLNVQSIDGLDNLADAGTNSVRVLTYHASKGLEWPVTICTDLGSKIRDNLWGASVQPEGDIDVANPLKNRFIRFWPWPFGKQQKVPLSDRVAQSQQASQFKMDAIEEAKRLMYVGLTRARDLLVLAHPTDSSGRIVSGEWIDSLDCPQLQSKSENSEIVFPSGIAIKCQYHELSAEHDEDLIDKARIEAVYWPTLKPKTTHLPLVMNPSAAAPIPCHIDEIANIGAPMQINGAPNLAQVGMAIHACIAAAASDISNLSEAIVKRLIDSNGASGSIEPQILINQISNFFEWCQNRYGNAPMMAEHPIEMVSENGQWMLGQIDLLLDTSDGWVLIDHKASARPDDSLADLANIYSGQLNAYKIALERATSKKVKETLLFLPVMGKSISIKY